MGRIVEYHTHSYGGQTFEEHVLSIQEELGKVVARNPGFTVIFVGETHNTMDERRRASVFASRPASLGLLTVIERGMGVPEGGRNLIVEANVLSPMNPRRDDLVVEEIAAELAARPYKGVLILFGEYHETGIRERMILSPAVAGMIWHFYPSFSDHAVKTKMVIPPHDPRTQGFHLVGMVDQKDEGKMHFMQLAEGAMPEAGSITLSIQTPFKDPDAESDYAVFAKPPLAVMIQLGLKAQRKYKLRVDSSNLKYIQLVDVRGKVRPVGQDLKNARSRSTMIEEFWVGAR